MPVPREKLDQLFADKEFLALNESEQTQLLDALNQPTPAQQTQPQQPLQTIQPKQSIVGNALKSATRQTFKPVADAMALSEAYNKVVDTAMKPLNYVSRQLDPVLLINRAATGGEDINIGPRINISSITNRLNQGLQNPRTQEMLRAATEYTGIQTPSQFAGTQLPSDIQMTYGGMTDMARRAMLDPMNAANKGSLVNRFVEGSSNKFRKVGDFIKGPQMPANVANRSWESFRGKLLSGDANALTHAGLKPDVVDDVVSTMKQYKMKQIPTKSEVSADFDAVYKNAPADMTITVNKTKNAIGRILRDAGLLDESNKRIRGIVSDSPLMNKLLAAYDDMNLRITLNKESRLRNLMKQPEGKTINVPGPSIGKPTTHEVFVPAKGNVKGPLLRGGKLAKTSQESLKEAVANTDTLDLDQFNRLMERIKSFKGPSKSENRFVYELVGSLAKEGESAGLAGLGMARDKWRIASHLEKINNLAQPSIASEAIAAREAMKLESLVNKAKTSGPARTILSQKVGSDLADEVMGYFDKVASREARIDKLKKVVKTLGAGYVIEKLGPFVP